MSVRSTGSTLVAASTAPTVGTDGEKTIYVEFEHDDQRNPLNFTLLKKWAITLTVCYFCGIAGASISSYSISIPSITRDLHCTDLQAALGLGLYAIGFGLVPLVTSSLSEEFGRRPVYIFSSLTFAMTQVMVALAPNTGVLLAGRVLEGMSGSTGASLVGGTIADIWRPEDRGLPMTMFAFTSVFAIGLGSVIGGVIQSTLGWRWVQWIHVMFSVVYIVLALLVLCETRSSIILIRIARARRKLSGDDHHKARAEINRQSFWSHAKTASSRPIYFLLTEPIVQSISIWVGFTWGVVFCLLEAVTPIFQTVYDFNVQQTGYVYATLSIGSIIGVFVNQYQDKLYRMYFDRRKQEARLYVTCVAALLLPMGMFIFAWTASPVIHWIVPLIGLTVFMTGVMIIFQVSFLYIADCYNTYASSAQAGSTLFRNLMALVFPLFTQRMFATLTYKWALTLFAALALLMAPIPFVLLFFGSKIRARSIASREILAADALPTQSDSSMSSLEVDKDKV